MDTKLMDQKDKHSVINWVNTHKKELILAGISITTIMGIIIGLKNKDDIVELRITLENKIKEIPDGGSHSMDEMCSVQLELNEVIPICQYNSSQEPIDVCQHIRNLSKGKHHSVKKELEAEGLGITLLPNQTLVDSYTKRVA